MPTLSEIMKIENEDRFADLSQFNKINLFTEGSFVRAYDFSAWLYLNVLHPGDKEFALQTTHRRTKDGTDYAFIGWPMSSMAKYIPPLLQAEVVGEKHSVVTIDEVRALKDDTYPIQQYQEWLNTIPLKEGKAKKSDEKSVKGLPREMSITMILQQVLGYDLSKHSPLEWGEFIMKIKEQLSKII